MGQVRGIVRLKGSRGGLIARLDTSASLEEILEELKQKLSEGKDFFRGARVRLDLGGRQGHPEEIEEIKRIFLEQGLVFDGIFSPEANAREGEPGERGDPESRALILHRTLRSGQKVTYRGSVIILGDVNPGAEITAGGHIIVMGKLRGVAHAGAGGDEEAMVTALTLDPAQLRIGKHLARSPDHKDEQGGEGPEWARLREGHIVISPLNKD